MNNKKSASVLFGVSLLFAGTAFAQNTNNLSPEEQRLLLQLLLKQQGLASSPAQAAQNGKTPMAPNGFVPAQGTSTPQTQAANSAIPGTMTEEDLGAALAKSSASGKGAIFERFKDGFAVNGTRYIDPEGAIVSYGFDTLSGNFTYIAHSSANTYLIKSGRANANGDPLTIGTAEKRGNLWVVTTVTGKKFSGERLIPGSWGFVVARANTGFRYIPGKGTSNFAAPEDFSIAALQNGDISNTGYILLERNPPSDGGTSLLSTFKALGSTLGINKKEDYALLNITNNKLVPINISFDDKTVQVMSACRQRNFMYAECARMDSFESLFQPNGMRNMTHYFWRISWFNTPTHPVLVSQEGGLSQVTVTDLTTGKKATIFQRSMGIAAFEARQKTDGSITVAAQMGFSRETKDNVVSLLDAVPDQPAEPDKQGALTTH